MSETISDELRARVLVDALPYIQKYAGKAVVIKYGGSAMGNPALEADVMRDIVLLSIIGVKVVLVHGGGPEITEMLHRVGLESRFVNGLRYTDEQTMEIVQMVLAGKVNKELVAKLEKCGGHAVGLCGLDGNMLQAKKKASDVDLGYVGEIVDIDVSPIVDALDSGYIPIIATIGAGADGKSYNINADTAASQIAETTGTLMLALAVAILLVYFILATQFNSFSLPIAIMLILPIGLLGSMILLWPTGNHVSMVALLGVIILAGTVVNSSIVLIDYTLQRRQRGEDKNTAILNACPRRVRPVLMTAMTTILGLVPMVCSSGEGSEMMKPMGVVMMTGMVISTIATLFITPVYYSLTDSVASRLSGLFKKIKLPKFNFHKKNPQQ